MNLSTCGRRRLLAPQTWKVMKLIIVLLTAAALQVSARGHSQTVTFSGTNVPLEKVFQVIEKQTGYLFFYNYSLLQDTRKVSLDVTNSPLNHVLQICFKDQPIDYLIENKTISISRKPAPVGAGLQPVPTVGVPTDVGMPIDIQGRIVNEQGEGVVASIVVKGTKTGTTSDENGNFLLKGVNESATLLITAANIIPFEVKISTATNGNLGTLIAKMKISPLDEIQVQAYGTTNRRIGTGNITTVKAKDIEKAPVSNVLLAIQGRVPGLFITQSSGLAGSGVSVRIQGQNSITRGTDPFYVVDGVPYTSQTLPTINSILGNSGNNAPAFMPSGTGNPLNFINPADIESIEVLKDADATAIYGSRAANGAILITTKKGKAGQTRVIVNMQQGWGKVPSKIDLLNTQQYLEMRKEALINDNASIGATDYDINGAWDNTRNTDWQKTLLGGTSMYSNVQASASGGNNLIQYVIGGGYHRETSVFPGTFIDQKGSMHLNLSSGSTNQKFKIQTTVNYLIDDNKLPSQDLTQRALELPPNAPELYNSDGGLNWQLLPNGTSTWTNPLSFALGKYNYKTNNLISNTSLSYKIFPGLEIKSVFGYNRLQTDEVQITPMISVAPDYQPFVQRTSNFGKGVINSWIVEPQLSYKRKIQKGNLEFLLGTTFQESKNNLLQLTGTGFNSDLVMEDLKAATSITIGSTLISNYKYSAIFGRINYNWLDKYIINLTGRRDGSSRFGSANLFNNFWGVAGAWIFSKEKFIEENLRFISFGKLRVSYGTTGNDQIGNYLFLNLYRPVSGIAVPYQGVSSIEPNGVPNPYLQWEETRKLQFGFDIGFLQDQVLLSANFGRNRSSNQLLAYSLPIMTGVGGITRNFPATIENSSWEFSVTTENLRASKLTWSTSMNLTIPKNKLLDFPNLATSTYANSLVIGEPFTISKKFHFLGVDPVTGLYSFADKDGNKTSSPNSSTDQIILINTSPSFYGGIQNSFSFNGFELDFLFQFVKQKGQNYSFGSGVPGVNYNQPTYVLNRWQKAGDITTIQRYNSTFSLISEYNSAAGLSDAGYTDASFIRLKNVSFSWQFPAALIKKLHVQNFRLYTHAQNLLTFTNYKGLDPETRSVSSLPILRVITVGVQITL